MCWGLAFGQASEQTEEPDKKSGAGKRSMPEWNEYEGPYFGTRIGALIIADYNMFDQDAANVAQVGPIDDEFEFRAARLVVRGYTGKSKRWTYFWAGEYNGMSREPGQNTFRMTDFAFTYDARRWGEVVIGRTKEPIHLARIMPGAGVLLMERAAIDALVPSRGTGIKWDKTVLDQNLNLSIGWFNDWLIAGSDAGDRHNQFTGRIAWTPLWAEEGRELVHLGISIRHGEAEEGTFRFREPPEANTAPDFIDTGIFPAEKANTVNLEFGAVHDNLSLQAEWIRMFVDSPETRDPTLGGWYLAASWVLTGESRTYIRKGGFFSTLRPNTQFGRGGGGLGAFELVARYSTADFSDRGLDGGDFSRWSLGLTWYANPSWRAMVNYGKSRLDRYGTKGDTDFLQFRLQWQM